MNNQQHVQGERFKLVMMPMYVAESDFDKLNPLYQSLYEPTEMSKVHKARIRQPTKSELLRLGLPPFNDPNKS